MIKKLNFFLSFFVFMLIILVCSNIINGKKIEKALYANTTEMHVDYKKDISYETLTTELVNVSKKHDINVSQYLFTGRNKLTILATNANKNKFFHLKKGELPHTNSNFFASNQNDNSAKKSGILNLPSSYLQIKLFDISYFRNVGLSNVFYIQGDSSAVEKILTNYGTTKVLTTNGTDTYTINQYQIIIISYLLAFFIVSTLSLSFSNRKKILLKRNYGYSMIQIVFDSIKDMNTVLYGLLLALGVCVVIRKESIQSILVSLLFSFALYISFTLLHIIMQLSIYYFGKINNTIKGKTPIKVSIVLLSIFLFIVLFLASSVFDKLELTYSEYKNMNSQLNTWKRTENLYKTNISNQLDRDNTIEEKQYLKRAQNFYQLIEKKYDTFIMAPYNYAVIEKDREGNPVYVGKSRFYNNIHESIVNMGGIDIFIDLNYLKRNPIMFSNPYELSEINEDKNVLYVLMPEKYKTYETEIRKKYLEYMQFIVKEEPSNSNSSISDIKPIYVKNNQKYFTYNYLYGNSKDNYFITDPIAIIVNPDLMSGLFWGNILTAEGGLYFDFNSSNNENVFDRLKPEIQKANLENTINFTISAFQDYGTYISKMQSVFFNTLLQGFVISSLFVIINYQIISFLFKINRKKIFLKRILGYSLINRVISIVYFPILISALSLFTFLVINPKKLYYTFSIFLLTIVLNSLIYGIIYFQTKNITFKESLYDT